MATTRQRIDAWLALAGPAVMALATAMVTLAPQKDRHRTLVSFWVILFFNVALLASLAQAVIDGSRARPRVIRWLNEVGEGSVARWRASGLRYGMLLAIGFAIMFAFKRVIRVKLDYDSAVVVAGAYAAFILFFELLGWWLSEQSLQMRRGARIAGLLWLGAAVVHTLVDGTSLWGWIESGPWRWFPFAGAVNDIYEALIKGERPPLPQLGAAAVCAVAGVALYARRTSNK